MTIEFTKHPIIKAPTDEEIVLLGEADPKLLSDLHEAHEGRIRSAESDPLHYGFELEGWKHVDKFFETVNTVYVSGGKRSYKTEMGARSVVKAAI